MKAELTDVTEVKKRLEIEIPIDVVDGEINAIAREYARRARVPGFRPGRAPLGVVKNRFRDDIVSEMYQHLLPRFFQEAVQERSLKIVDSPSFEEIDYSSGQPVRFKARFEVYPELDVTNHSNIPVEAVPTEVSDEEVDAALERALEEHAEMTPVEEDREVQTGDHVEISFTGTLGGEDAEELSSEKALCEIGGATTIDEFTENLTGARAGEERSFEVNYKDDHPEKKLAGKTARYDVTVESIKEKTRPQLDDDFAQGLGDYKTVAELRTRVREDLEAHKREHAEQQTRDALLRWLEDNNEFEVPESLVEHQVDVRLDRLVRDLTRQGMNPQRLDVDWSKIRHDQYEQAVRDVKGSLILDHLAEREGIEVAETDVDKEIETMASEMNRTGDSVRDALRQSNGIDRIKGQIRNNKVLDFLLERAQVVPAASLAESPSVEA